MLSSSDNEFALNNHLEKGGFRMKTFSRITFLASLLLAPAMMHAQSGCVNSPECPTAILGIVGAGAAALYARFRSR